MSIGYLKYVADYRAEQGISDISSFLDLSEFIAQEFDRNPSFSAHIDPVLLNMWKNELRVLESLT